MVHIGIIPDGNRRWCKKNGYKLDTITEIWTKLFIENIIKLSRNRFKYLKDITELSLYVCSIDNIKREDNTENLIYELIRSIYNIFKNPEGILPVETINSLKYIKMNFIGEISLLPPDIQEILTYFESLCKNVKFTVNFAIAYDYNKDIINVSTQNLKNYTRKQSDIDILLRSGGEYRTSGFFPTKILYSELFFSKKLWPEIKLSCINNVIKKFRARNRRFGK